MSSLTKEKNTASVLFLNHYTVITLFYCYIILSHLLLGTLGDTITTKKHFVPYLRCCMALKSSTTSAVATSSLIRNKLGNANRCYQMSFGTNRYFASRRYLHHIQLNSGVRTSTAFTNYNCNNNNKVYQTVYQQRKLFVSSKLVTSMTKKRNFKKMIGMNLSSLSPSNNDVSNNINESTNTKKLVIVIAGPTAVGKSSIGSKICSQEMATDILYNHSLNNIYNNSNLNIDKLNSRGHIISADSVQVYQGVQIGANKPTKEEMDKTPHHLIDIVESETVCQYNAADWMRDALYVIGRLTTHASRSQEGSNCIDGKSDDDDSYIENATENSANKGDDEKAIATNRMEQIKKYIEQKCMTDDLSEKQEKNLNILPVVVGGTMMYLQWLVHGRPDVMKPSQDAVEKAANIVSRFQKQEEASESRLVTDHLIDSNSLQGWKAAVEHVSSLGPIFADRVSKLPGKDWYRLRRTLEVAYTVKEDPNNEAKINELYSGQRQGGLDSSEYDVRCFFLCPDDRMSHTGVVDERCEDMLIAGLIKETIDLSSTGQLPEEGQLARAIGYRQTLDYLKRDDVLPNDSVAFGKYLEQFTTATRRYAKKQMQWFRRDEKFVFVPVKLSEPSQVRVDSAAKIIRDLCIIPRAEYEHELAPVKKDNNNNQDRSVKRMENICSEKQQLSISAKTKLENEKQGKKMKFYQPKRHKLIENSNDFKNVMIEADESSVRMTSGK